MIESTGDYKKLLEKRRLSFLEWLRDSFKPVVFLYAGSGLDRVPKTVFGEDIVVHLSFEEGGINHRPYKSGYFLFLGSGKKIGADFLYTPLKTGSVDMVYIHDAPPDVTGQAIPEFFRALKDSGLLVLDNSDWAEKEIQGFLARTADTFESSTLPSRFADPNNSLKRVTMGNMVGTRPGCGIGVGYAETLAETQMLLDKIPEPLRCVTPQMFSIYKKKLMP